MTNETQQHDINGKPLFVQANVYVADKSLFLKGKVLTISDKTVQVGILDEDGNVVNAIRVQKPSDRLLLIPFVDDTPKQSMFED